LGKLLGQHKDDDDFVLLEDILDQELIDDTAISPVSESENDQFERLRKVPLGTFWNSQRSRAKISKRRDIQKAVKRASDNKLLESTLLETLPNVKSKRRKSLSFASPMLLAIDTSKPSFQADDITPSYLIPPPLNLN
jgi:hypothetical protein